MKIFREIVHYIGVAVKLPFVALLFISVVVIYLLQTASCCLRVCLDEPDFKQPMIGYAYVLRRISDIIYSNLENIPE